MDILDGMMIAAQIRLAKLKQGVKEFFIAEDGINNIVATILILLIVLVVIGIFWGAFSGFFSDLIDKVLNKGNEVTENILE